MIENETMANTNIVQLGILKTNELDEFLKQLR